MVSREVLCERGVFTCDMDELRERFDEIYSTITMLVTHGHIAQDAELQLALQGVARSVIAVSRDVSEVDRVLRERGAIVDAHAYLRRQRQQQDDWQPGGRASAGREV